MTFLAPLALLGVLFAIPIILLYVLRFRRKETLVSSHFLWQRVLKDQQANTPFQRLRRNLFLLLQLIVLAFLVLALARPALFLPSAIGGGRVVILMDASASMNTLEPDGRTRWQIAQAEALSLIEQLGATQRASVYRVGDTISVLANDTPNTPALRQAIQTAPAGQGRADLDTALTLAIGNANTPDDSLYILTDGGIDRLNALPQTITTPRVMSIGTPQENLAITALGTRVQNGTPLLFTQVTHYGNQEASFSVVLRLDGVLWQSQRAKLAPNSQIALLAPIDRPFSTVQATLVLDEGVTDALPLDDTAVLAAENIAPLRVLLISSGESRFLNQALSPLPNIVLDRGDSTRRTLPQTPYDVIVMEGYLPDELPTNADLLIIQPPDSTPLFTLGAPQENRAPLRLISPEHPAMRFVEASGVTLRAFRPLIAPSSDLEALWQSGDEGVLWAGERDGQQLLLLPFALGDTDLPLQIAFPILMANAMAWFSPQNPISPQTGGIVGDVITLSPPLTADDVRVTLPNGDTLSLGREGAFSQTTQAGFYTFVALEGEREIAIQTLAFNPPLAESQITPRSIALSVLGGTPAPDEGTPTNRLSEGWGVLIALALAVIMLEWVLYHRQF